MTDDNHFGTPEERLRVRSALELLSKFNTELEGLRQIGIKCSLEQRGSGYVAEFTQTRLIYPSAKSE